jgi:hypothetical protein
MYCKKNNSKVDVTSLFIKEAWVPAITVCENNMLFYKQNPNFKENGSVYGDYAILGAAPDEAWLTEIKNGLLNTSIISNIDIIDVLNSVPTLKTLKNYKSILVFSDESFHNGELLGNIVANYADYGGGVVVSVFESSMPSLLGRWQSELYDPLDPVDQSEGERFILGDILVPEHPIMENVNTFDGGSSSYYGTGNPLNNTTVIAKWSNDVPLIIERNLKNNGDNLNNKIVCLNFYPPSNISRVDFWDSSTDGYKIIANSLKYTSI